MKAFANLFKSQSSKEQEPKAASEQSFKAPQGNLQKEFEASPGN